MKDSLQSLNLEYGLKLTDEEMDQIAKQAEAMQRLLHKLFEVDVTAIVPALKVDLIKNP